MAAAVGYRFKPTEEEIVSLLEARVKGDEEINWNEYPMIMESDLHGKRTPGEMFTNLNQKWYSFTRLKKTSKKRVSRVAGNGTWHGEASAVEIRSCDTNNNRKRIVGFKKTFAFKVKGVRDDRTSWIMHEFSLHESCDLVLCVIKKKTKKSQSRRLEDKQEPFITFTPSNTHLEDEVRLRSADQVGVMTSGSSIFLNQHQLMLQPSLPAPTEILKNDNILSIPGGDLVNRSGDFLMDKVDFDFEPIIIPSNNHLEEQVGVRFGDQLGVPTRSSIPDVVDLDLVKAHEDFLMDAMDFLMDAVDFEV